MFWLSFLFFYYLLFIKYEDCPTQVKIYHRSTGALNKDVDKKTFKKWYRKDRHLETTNKSEIQVVLENEDIIEVYRSKTKGGRAYLFSEKGVLNKQFKFSVKHHIVNAVRIVRLCFTKIKRVN